MTEHEVCLSSPWQPHINGKPHAIPHPAEQHSPSCLIGSPAHQTTYAFSLYYHQRGKNRTKISYIGFFTMTSTLKQPTFLRVKGTDIVDGDGNRVILKGVRDS